MFAILGLVPPFLNYFFGDMFDVNDYISAMNFINSLLLPILVVSFVVDDQGSRISDYYFKTRQGRHLYLFSLLICGLCLGLLAGFLLIGVVRELRNENIDVIQWSKNPEILVKRALGNVTINKIEINEETNYALVYTPVEEISKVIGKQGQNIRLASWLTGYEIDVYRESSEDDDVELKEFNDDIEQWILDEFKKVGLTTAKSVLDKETESLLNMVDLEEETIEEVKRILREEFED